MKKIFKTFAVIGIVGLVFTGCQKDGDVITEEATQLGSELIIDASQSYPVLKAPVPIKPGAVNIPDGVWNLIPYETLKIRNLASTVIQEWIKVDMKTPLFAYSSTQAGDASGDTHGFYYKWKGALWDTQQTDWDGIIFDDVWNPETGFHIPTDADINNLASVVGGTGNIPDYLQLDYDGAANWGPDYSSTFAAFWIDQPGNPNIQPGCGVYGIWYANSNSYGNAYTNTTDLRVNVRLVRNITLAKWME